jgi:hypothetical protein
MVKVKKVCLLRYTVLALLVLAFSTTMMAKRSSTKGKWKILFDGKNTEALRGFKRDSFPSKEWIIDNGTLKTVVGSRCDLITKDKYKNFELYLEWKVSPGGNSGVMYHVSENLEQPWHTGPEMQILDNTKHPDGKNPKTSAGALYGLIAPSTIYTSVSSEVTINKALKPVGQFNEARLIVNNNHVEHWLNGKKLVEYQLGTDQLKELIANSKFNPFPNFAKEGSGHIVIQHHGEEVWFRNIKVREID